MYNVHLYTILNVVQSKQPDWSGRLLIFLKCSCFHSDFCIQGYSQWQIWQSSLLHWNVRRRSEEQLKGKSKDRKLSPRSGLSSQAKARQGSSSSVLCILTLYNPCSNPSLPPSQAIHCSVWRTDGGRRSPSQLSPGSWTVSSGPGSLSTFCIL